jgi:YidC/Oxa1 family membrane protein insertase
MLLFLVYDALYYSPKVKEAQREQRAAALLEQARRQADSLAAESIPESATESNTTPVTQAVPPGVPDIGHEVGTAQNLVSQGSMVPARFVTVTSPLYHITLSTKGAEIVSCRLLGYETYGEPVELFGQAQDSIRVWAASVSLLGQESVVSLSDVPFQVFLKGGGRELEDGEQIHVDPAAGTTLIFRAGGDSGGRIERTYSFTPESYVVRAGVRFSATQFPRVREVGWNLGPGLSSTEAHRTDDQINFRASVRLGEEYHKHKPGDFLEEYSGMVNWAALQTKYFTAILMPEAPTVGEVTLAGIKDVHHMSAAMRFPVTDRQGSVRQAIDIYLGPLDYGILKGMDRGLEKNIDMGFKLFQPVSRAILWSMIKLYKLIPNYGIVIILLSVFTKVLFYRLTHKSFKSMRDMQALQPKMQALKAKFKDDRQRMSQETMKLYKEHGVNPLGGCLPMLFQMPVFIALFSVLKFTIEVRGAHFVGWMNDLAQQDVLFTMPFSLPVVGSAVSVLPILMGAAMLLQSKIGGSIAGPSSAATQPKMFTYMLPIVFTVIFYRMPSGLVLYWLVNNVMSIAQQYYINKDGSDDEKNDGKDTQPNKSKKPKKAKKTVHPRRSKLKMKEG